ncbi:hypothetical protein BDV96DRAFT_238684 [Lophiotrema nucula]|uniref:Uncharacterized protein n=1 Tax=Lophiotrema nucula TaxID=690887 RepID=A0A6A5YQZ0_9PLEO|nr:hypothetical protein BDV96DRAFT_238684 [Lophiotrema nucula]
MPSSARSLQQFKMPTPAAMHAALQASEVRTILRDVAKLEELIVSSLHEIEIREALLRDRRTNTRDGIKDVQQLWKVLLQQRRQLNSLKTRLRKLVA